MYIWIQLASRHSLYNTPEIFEGRTWCMHVCMYLCMSAGASSTWYEIMIFHSNENRLDSPLFWVIPKRDSIWVPFVPTRPDTDLVARYASISGWERQVIIKWWKFNLHNIKYGKWAQCTEQSQRSWRGGTGGMASNSAALVTMWGGNLALFMYLCARDSGWVCVCEWVWFIIMQIRPSRLVYL